MNATISFFPRSSMNPFSTLVFFQLTFIYKLSILHVVFICLLHIFFSILLHLLVYWSDLCVLAFIIGHFCSFFPLFQQTIIFDFRNSPIYIFSSFCVLFIFHVLLPIFVYVFDFILDH